MALRSRLLTIALAAAALAAGCDDLEMPDRAEADCLDDQSDVCWQRLSAIESMTWYDAVDYCDAMGLGGYAWRLPSIDELRTLVAGCAGAEPGGACPVTEECLASACATADCAGCGIWGGPGYGGCYWGDDVEGGCGCYWTASEYADSATQAWTVGFDSGAVIGSDKSVWCNVRCLAETGG